MGGLFLESTLSTWQGRNIGGVVRYNGNPVAVCSLPAPCGGQGVTRLLCTNISIILTSIIIISSSTFLNIMISVLLLWLIKLLCLNMTHHPWKIREYGGRKESGPCIQENVLYQQSEIQDICLTNIAGLNYLLFCLLFYPLFQSSLLIYFVFYHKITFNTRSFQSLGHFYH